MLKTKSSIHVHVLLKKLFLKIIVNFIFTSKQIKINAVSLDWNSFPVST